MDSNIKSFRKNKNTKQWDKMVRFFLFSYKFLSFEVIEYASAKKKKKKK